MLALSLFTVFDLANLACWVCGIAVVFQVLEIFCQLTNNDTNEEEE